MIRAAVLEDTPDAPFLLSLPILKALDTTLSLGHGNMHFQAIHESGKMFYNDKGQLCLKLFEFDAIAECSENSPDQWKVQKIIGDECQVFLLQQPLPNQITGEIDNLGDKSHQMKSRDMQLDNGVVMGNYNPNPVAYSDTKHVDADAVETINCTESKVSVSRFSKSATAPTDVFQSQSNSSIAETPLSNPRPCHSDHGGADVVSRQQESMHLTCGGQSKVCQPVVTHVQQAQDPGTSGHHGPTHDRIGNTIDECVDASTGDDDEGCGYGRGRHSSRDDEPHGDRKEETRKGHERKLDGNSMLPEVQGSTLTEDQHNRQFLSDLSRKSGPTHDAVTQTSRAIQFKPECEVSELDRAVLLRPEAGSVHLPQAGTQLHETVLPMPQRTTVHTSVPLLPVDPGDQGRGVRENLCFLTRVETANRHSSEIKEALRRRIRLLRRARRGLQPWTESGDPKPNKVSSCTSQRVQPSVEQTRHQCVSEDAHMHALWTPGDHHLQEQPDHAAMGGRDQPQEIRTATCSESVSIKTGQRKHILGEIQKRIEQLEHDTVKHSFDETNVIDEDVSDSNLVKELMHLRLIGEVFSPNRFCV